MVGNPIQIDYTVFATLFSLLFVLFIIYSMVSAMRFFKRKRATDKELLQKLDELIKLQKKSE